MIHITSHFVECFSSTVRIPAIHTENLFLFGCNVCYQMGSFRESFVIHTRMYVINKNHNGYLYRLFVAKTTHISTIGSVSQQFAINLPFLLAIGDFTSFKINVGFASLPLTFTCNISAEQRRCSLRPEEKENFPLL